jgi:poly-D-alanine transfer protein DltD
MLKQCEKDKSTLNKLIEKQQAAIDKIQKQIVKITKKQEEQDAILEVKVDVEEMEEIKDLILQLPKVEDVKALKKFVTDNIEHFSKDNKTFH